MRKINKLMASSKAQEMVRVKISKMVCTKTRRMACVRTRKMVRVKTRKKVWAIDTRNHSLELIDNEAIPSYFEMVVPDDDDCIYYHVAKQFEVYYKYWLEIERKLLFLKGFLPSERYSSLYNEWVGESAFVNSSIFSLFSIYMGKAYKEAIECHDVRISPPDERQIRIVGHMQKLWSLDSIYFCGDVLYHGDDWDYWNSAYDWLNLAISIQEKFNAKINTVLEGIDFSN